MKTVTTLLGTRTLMLATALMAVASAAPAAEDQPGRLLDPAQPALAPGTTAGEGAAQGPLPWSISVAGGFQHLGRVNRDTGVGTDNYLLNGQLSLGYFFTDHFKAEVGLGAQTSGDDTGFNNGNLFELAALKYYIWPYKEFTPYLGIQAGGFTTFSPGSTVTDPALGGMAGFEFYLTEAHSTSLFLEYNFLYIRDEIYNTYQNRINIGISWHFGK